MTGRQVNNFYAADAPRPAEFPGPERFAKAKCSDGTPGHCAPAPPAPDYTGPVILEPRRRVALLAEVLTPVDRVAARPPMPLSRLVEQLMRASAARSDWKSGKVGRAFFPPVGCVTLMITQPQDTKGACSSAVMPSTRKGFPGRKRSRWGTKAAQEHVLSADRTDFEKTTATPQRVLERARPVMSPKNRSVTRRKSLKEDLKKKFSTPAVMEKNSSTASSSARWRTRPASLMHQEISSNSWPASAATQAHRSFASSRLEHLYPSDGQKKSSVRAHQRLQTSQSLSKMQPSATTAPSFQLMHNRRRCAGTAAWTASEPPRTASARVP